MAPLFSLTSGSDHHLADTCVLKDDCLSEEMVEEVTLAGGADVLHPLLPALTIDYCKRSPHLAASFMPFQKLIVDRLLIQFQR